MLDMAEGINQDILWESEKSWSFPNLLEVSEENGEGKKLEINSNQENAQAAKDDNKELAQPDPPPPATAAGKGKKRTAAQKGGSGGGRGESDHDELHIWTERERRKKMRNMFASLHALLPHLPPRSDKSTIVDEAVVYIKKLQQNLQELEKQKLERFNGIITNNSVITQQRLAIPSMEVALSTNPNNIIASPHFSGPEFPTIFKTWTSANVVLNVSGREAHISVCGPKKSRLLTGICFVMEKYKLEVVSAQVSSDRNKCMYMIHTHANGGSDVFQQAFPVEEIYKQAAAEIMLWVNS